MSTVEAAFKAHAQQPKIVQSQSHIEIVKQSNTVATINISQFVGVKVNAVMLILLTIYVLQA